MSLLQLVDDALQRPVRYPGVVRLETLGVFSCRRKLFGRVLDDADLDAALGEPLFKVAVVGVIVLLEDEDRIDVVPSQQKRLVSRNRGRDAAECGRRDENGRRKQRSERVEL